MVVVSFSVSLAAGKGQDRQIVTLTGLPPDREIERAFSVTSRSICFEQTCLAILPVIHLFLSADLNVAVMR
jgi:hypothetical protein